MDVNVGREVIYKQAGKQITNMRQQGRVMDQAMVR